MEPRIQYAKTSDGVNIAFWTLGKGPPLVAAPGGISHCQLEWNIAECRRWYEALAQRHQLVVLDGRGIGLSDRNVDASTIEDNIRDMQAVIDRLGLKAVSIFASMHSAPVAVHYAVKNPERVTRLILWSGYAAPSEWADRPEIQASRSLVDKDWVFFTETYARRVMGWSQGEPAKRYAALIRESIDPEFVQASYRSFRKERGDASPLLPELLTPTLVLQRRNAIPGVQVARSLAARIPDARLSILEGESAAPFLEDSESVLAEVEDFLADGQASEKGEPSLPSGTALILFADIADSTGLTERLGDAAFREKARDLDATLRTVIREHSGTPIEGKLLGDGVLATFTSARQAIEAALACARSGDDTGLPLHLGLHAGDVIREDNNVYGGAVNVAARISGLSAPGEVLVSETVRSLARTSASVSFEDRGEQSLKGVGEPVRVWAVQEGE